MKLSKTKALKFLNGRGFYIVMAACMAAVGFMAFSSIDKKQPEKNDIKDNIFSESESGNTNEEIKPQTQKEDGENQNTDITVQNETPETNEEENFLAAQNNAESAFFSLPVENGTLLKDFSLNELQYSETYKDLRLHTGIDILPGGNLLVKSCAGGKVLSIDEDTIMGTVITADHGNGIYIRYCGVKNVKIKPGDTLTQNGVIAEIGTVTGECADEAHLHLEVIKDGVNIDPKTVLPIK